MSVLRPLLSMRGRLVFVATALLLVGAFVAAPSVSDAKPASVKQFIASISGGDGGSLTMTITNCGGAPLVLPCSASSTIALGSVRISIGPDSDYAPVAVPTVTSPDGRNWIATYDSTTGNLDAHAVGGNDKLQPGEIANITWQFASSATTCAEQEFPTAAWGSIAISGADPFVRVGSQPSLNCVAAGGSVTGPGGQIETIDGNFTGHVLVTFGGPAPDCGGPEFGALGDQWQQYHLPNPVTITPAGDFHVGTPPEDKVWTSEFPLSTAPGGPSADSSWYLICYGVPQAGHTPFVTRGGGTAVAQDVGGVPNFVGILANCADAATPCVSEQFLTTGPGAPPWSPSATMVHIAHTTNPEDPHHS
jgi:hypothetical protein